MWFRMQEMIIEDAPAPANGVKGLEDITATKDATVVTSIPAEPGDFLRVRLLRMPLKVMQPEAVEIENESDHAGEDVSGEAVRDLGAEDPYDADHDSGREKSSSFRRRRRPATYINAQRVVVTDHRNGFEERLSRWASTSRERIMVVPNPPTARSPPVNFTLTPPLRFHDPSVSREHYSRPYIVDERPRIVEPHSIPRYRYMSDDNEEPAQRRRERDDARQLRKATELRERIERANAEIRSRPVVRVSPVQLGEFTVVEGSEAHLDAIKRELDKAAVLEYRLREREDARQLRKETELRERIERAYSEIRSRPIVRVSPVQLGESTVVEGSEAHLDAIKRERDETAVLEHRLRERMLPARRASIGPGSRRHRVAYGEGLYRWE